MPLMPFYCAKCAKHFSRFRSLSQAKDGASCPLCGQKVFLRKDVVTPAHAAVIDRSPKAS